MADEFLDLFNQLFYSEQVWTFLGVFGIIIIALIVAYQVKGAFPFCTIILLLMAISYFDHVLAGGFFIWHIIFLFFGAIISIFLGIDNLKQR